MNSTRGTLEEVNIQSLQPGARYILRVVAYNEHGAGDSSAPLTVSSCVQTKFDLLFNNITI